MELTTPAPAGDTLHNQTTQHKENIMKMQDCWTWTKEQNHHCRHLPTNINVWILRSGMPKKYKVEDVYYHETVFLTLEDCILYYEKYYFQG